MSDLSNSENFAECADRYPEVVKGYTNLKVNQEKYMTVTKQLKENIMSLTFTVTSGKVRLLQVMDQLRVLKGMLEKDKLSLEETAPDCNC